MAAIIATDFKRLLTLKSKSRLDSIGDQYNRIFMVRVLLVCTTVMGISWYVDTMNCIVPMNKDAKSETRFISAACWIQGLYVYKQLVDRTDNKIAYYGIPKNMDFEGMFDDTKELCTLRPKLGVLPSPDCKAMTKTFFLQYQYMPFFIAALSILYYIPYVAFQIVNRDLTLLRNSIDSWKVYTKKHTEQKDTNKDNQKTAKRFCKNGEEFVKHYFPNFKETKRGVCIRNSDRMKLTLRITFNVIVKLLYFFSNVICLLALNFILNGEYISYGPSFIRWSQLDNTVQDDYIGGRQFPKPGNLLLPPFGYCEVYESSRDIRSTSANQHKFICEISQHVLYQYCFAVIWFAIFAGYMASVGGFIHLILNYIYLGMSRDGDGQEFQYLHIRELELLAFIKRKEPALYVECQEVLRTKGNSKLHTTAYNL